jgi:hypothetical protein
MRFQQFNQQIKSSYIQCKTAAPHEYIFEQNPFELTVLGVECPFVIDDTIDKSARDSSDGSGEQVMNPQPLKADVCQAKVCYRGELGR